VGDIFGKIIESFIVFWNLKKIFEEILENLGIF
jgi:hypothetical protein